MASGNATSKNKKKKSPRLKNYEFEGINQITNELVRGQIRAVDEKDSRRQLAYKNVKIIKLTVIKKRNKRIKSSDVTVFTRQLASMLKAGVPLLQSFDIVAKGHSNSMMTKTLLEIKSEIEQGSSLNEALAKYPQYFDDLYIGLVQAGESGGVLEIILDRLASNREKNMKMVRNIRKALIYPIAVISISIAVIIFMLIFVLPTFKELYDSMDTELPWLTNAVIATSDFLVNYGIYIVILVIIGIILFIRKYRKSLKFKEKISSYILKLPLFGALIEKAEVSKWGRTFSTLYSAGVPMVENLELVADSSKNILYKNATKQIQLQVSQGEKLVSSLRSVGDIFPPLFNQLAEVGEESGSLDEMLNKAADYYEDEVDDFVASLDAILEPVIIVILGIFVGIILLAMYLPLFNLAANL